MDTVLHETPSHRDLQAKSPSSSRKACPPATALIEVVKQITDAKPNLNAVIGHVVRVEHPEARTLIGSRLAVVGHEKRVATALVDVLQDHVDFGSRTTITPVHFAHVDTPWC
jgi:hypothetical protein